MSELLANVWGWAIVVLWPAALLVVVVRGLLDKGRGTVPRDQRVPGVEDETYRGKEA